MIKTDIIRAGWLSNLVGPSRTLNRIIKNKSYYRQRGYEVEIYTMDQLSKKEFPPTTSVNPASLVKSFIRKLAFHSSLVCRLLMKYTLMRYAEQITNYYLSLNRASDIVVFHDIFSCYFFLKNTPRRQVKTVLFYHNNGAAFDSFLFYYPCLKNSNYLKYLLEIEKYILSQIDKVVFIAEYGRQNFFRIHPDFDFNKTIFFHNGIEDLPKTMNEENILFPHSFKYRLCCVGTINERKGQRIIIEALAQVSLAVRKNIHVSFIGDGPLKNELEKLVSTKGLSAQVTFEGAMDNSKIDSHLRQVNIFILMSYEEGLPISIIEALRAGLPVISTRVGGIPELVIENENGFLLDPDVRQLAVLLQHLEDFDWKTLGYNSRQYFLQKFTFKKMMENYCNMLDSL